MEQTCHVEPIQKTVLDSVIRNADITLLAVSGMGCQNCANRVRNALLLLADVYHVEIYLEMGLAKVYFDSKQISIDMLVDAVASAGNDGRHHYQAQVISNQPA